MTEKAKKNKNLIIGICSTVVVVVVIVVAVVLATRGGKLDDSYFVSDDTKYVMTLDASSMSLEDENYPPIKSHIVYFYSGDDITGMKMYNEFADEDTAKAAYEELKSDNSEDYKEVNLEGKYVVLTANESEYESLKASDVKQQIEFMEMLKNTNLNENSDSNENSSDTTNEETSETENTAEN